MPTNLPLLYSMFGWHWGLGRSLLSFTCSLSKAEIQCFNEVPCSPPSFSCQTQSPRKCLSCLYSFYTFCVCEDGDRSSSSSSVRQRSQGRLHQVQGAPQGGDAGVHNQEAYHGYIQVNLKTPFYGFQHNYLKYLCFCFVLLFVDNMDHLVHN